MNDAFIMAYNNNTNNKKEVLGAVNNKNPKEICMIQRLKIHIMKATFEKLRKDPITETFYSFHRSTSLESLCC